MATSDKPKRLKVRVGQIAQLAPKYLLREVRITSVRPLRGEAYGITYNIALADIVSVSEASEPLT